MEHGHEYFNSYLYDKVNNMYFYIGSLIYTLSSHTNHIYCLKQLSNGQLLSGSSDNTVKIWDVNTGQLVQTLTYNCNARKFEILSNGNNLAIGCYNEIQIWNMATNTLVKTIFTV